MKFTENLFLICIAITTALPSNLLFAQKTVAPKLKVVEYWRCSENPYGSKILVIAEVYKGRQFGKIKVAGVDYYTIYAVRGFDRRWDFGYQKNGSFNYAFVIKPNGFASYYDFSTVMAGQKTKPSMVLYCKK